MATIAFDVYGTLIDTDGVVSQLREWIGSQADVFSQTWRSKQLEYSFRRGLMRRYENFAVCTRQALDYCCAEYDVSFSAEQKDALLQSYRALPAFSDADESLVALKAGGHRLFAFSNGAAEAVEESPAEEAEAEEPAAADSSAMSVDDILAAARGDAGGAAETVAEEEAAGDEDAAEASPAEEAEEPAASTGDLPADVDGIIAYCQRVDGGE